MFLDMAMLVQYQGEMLNNIESNVKASKNYIFDANSDLKKAKKAHLSARQVKILFFSILKSLI